MDQSGKKWVNVDHNQNTSSARSTSTTQRLDTMQENEAFHTRQSIDSEKEGNILSSTNTMYGNLTEAAMPQYYSNYKEEILNDVNRNKDINRIDVSVSEPIKQGEGMQAYISYRINTNTDRPQFARQSFSAVRRYSDFVWLHGILSATYSGVVIPPLPEKLLVGRFSPEFVESRRRALQLFLHRCCMHPEIQHDDQLTVFLEVSEERLQQYKLEYATRFGKQSKFGQFAAAAVAGSSTATSLFQWFDETVNTISSTVIGAGTNAVSGKHVMEKTTADVEIEEMMAYMDGLEPIIAGLHKHAHGLTKRAREIADGLFEFGVSFTQLGKSEENESLQEGLYYIGECADQLSLLAAEHAEKEAIHFEEPIADYIRLVASAKAALQKRNDVRNAYANAVLDLEYKTQISTKLVNQNTGSSEKFQLAGIDVVKAQERVDNAKLEYDVVTERVLREVKRFKEQKAIDFKRIVLDYIHLQIAYSQRVEKEWEQVVPKLANIQIPSSQVDTAQEDVSNVAVEVEGLDSLGRKMNVTNAEIAAADVIL
uniref:Sorting nexin putative n=1 Tax=Albugo laibachii Nc14 TaxID=890382 RepID=F0WC90_9STRA|nr:sorting nexin putative [Albugo laibachii Nc14]|eukprot:CCA18803.1 sorting nexin putative [Albugo laibachii Nc14]